jgi:AcrR family transcriptional regulator
MRTRVEATPPRAAVRSAVMRSTVMRSAAGAQRRLARVSSCDHDHIEGAQVAEIQRSRLLAGAVGAIEESGYARTTVAQITARARVSRRTFYELFDNREACFAALLEDVVGMVEGEIAAAGLSGRAWRERVRGGLAVILAFFDREPALARVCIVEALRGGPEVLERREEILARLARVIDEGRCEGARGSGSERTALTAEGLAGAAFTIVHARLARAERAPSAERAPLGALLGELTSLIVLPYLGSAAARREHARSARASASAETSASAESTTLRMIHDPLQGVPMRLTYRTARVLQCIAERPGISNREVADHAGVADQGQISKLLARLKRLGLTANGGPEHAKGEPNAWTLTPLGEQVAQRLQLSSGYRTEAA